MLSSDDRSSSLFNPKSQGLRKPVPSLGLLSSENSPTTPLPVHKAGGEPETAILPAQLPQMSPVQYSPLTPVSTRQLSLLNNRPGVTRVLTEASAGGTGGERPPVVIKGNMKRPLPPLPLPHEVHKKRRLFVSVTGLSILLLITVLALVIATPLGHDVGMGFDTLRSGNNSLVNSANNTITLVSQATATAVYNQQNDGYSGGNLITDGSGSLNWPLGQCTYWANYRYHQLTGFWVTWSGNADQWVAGAQAAGWQVSQAPHIPSILVMMPYTQGASGYGHVAVVESIVSNGSRSNTSGGNNTSASGTPGTGTPTPTSTPTPTPPPASGPIIVHTSNFNWYANGGGWDTLSYVDFSTGPGIYFIWHS